MTRRAFGACALACTVLSAIVALAVPALREQEHVPRAEAQPARPADPASVTLGDLDARVVGVTAATSPDVRFPSTVWLDLSVTNRSSRPQTFNARTARVTLAGADGAIRAREAGRLAPGATGTQRLRFALDARTVASIRRARHRVEVEMTSFAVPTKRGRFQIKLPSNVLAGERL